MRVTDTKSFIIKAKSIHNDKYDYSLVNYVNAKTKVNIICKVEGHGVFEQVPDSHSHGNGCPKCANYERINTKILNSKKDLLIKFNKKHNNIYDYSKFKYKGTSIKSTIICGAHGEFKQTPANHKRGQGCPKCGFLNRVKKRTFTTEEFIEKAKLKHGDKYDYSLVEYVNNHTKVRIECANHGTFEQIPANHLNGDGCKSCGYEISSKCHKNNPTGWSASRWNESAKNSKNFDSFKVYVIRCCNDNENFYKIGRTFKKTKKRFQSISEMPYKYEILHEFIFDTAKEAYDKETELKRINKKYRYLPTIYFGGKYECFSEINLEKTYGTD